MNTAAMSFDMGLPPGDVRGLESSLSPTHANAGLTQARQRASPVSRSLIDAPLSIDPDRRNV